MVRDFEEFKNLRDAGFSRAALALRRVADEKHADPKSDANLFLRDYSEQDLRTFADELEKQQIPVGLAILKKK